MQLKSGSLNVQEGAARAVGELGWNSSVKDAIIAAGALPILAECLMSDQPGLQMNAAKAISNLACAWGLSRREFEDEIVAAGVMPALLWVLKSEQPGVHGKAIELLLYLAYSGVGDAIIAADAQSVLVHQLRSGQPEVQRRAAMALRTLAINSRIPQQAKDAVAAASAVPELMALMKSGQSDLQEKAAEALSTLMDEYWSSWTQHMTEVVKQVGALPTAVALLKSDRPDVQVAAAKLLGFMARSQQDKEALIAAGGLTSLVLQLHSENPVLQRQVASTLRRLTDYSQQSIDAIVTSDAVVASGALPWLVGLLKSTDGGVKHEAPWILVTFVRSSQANKDAVHEAMVAQHIDLELISCIDSGSIP